MRFATSKIHTVADILKRLSLCMVLAIGLSPVHGAENKTTEAPYDSTVYNINAAPTDCSVRTDTLVQNISKYDKHSMRYRAHWNVLIPTQGVIQTCGNMGIVALGLGWDYGHKRQWETHLLLGLVPRFSSKSSKLTLTLKENFTPWCRNIGKGWQFEPLECSLYFNTVFGHDFWTKQPTKYESGYYPFSTRIRPNLALGERFKYNIPCNRRKRIKSVTFFYELGTNDIYFMRFYRNGSAGFWDVFGISLGAKVQYL